MSKTLKKKHGADNYKKIGLIVSVSGAVIILGIFIIALFAFDTLKTIEAPLENLSKNTSRAVYLPVSYIIVSIALFLILYGTAIYTKKASLWRILLYLICGFSGGIFIQYFLAIVIILVHFN